ncbi:MAG: 3-oxoacyl-ACP reductase FabG [Rhodocyclaceae bacterium]|nr:3-oxoacyl-ACP reductase FabG [Rhodocyclaceae bacterium]
MQDVLKGQIALVTGAARGIGHVIAHELGRRGATIIGADINEAAAAEIQKSLDDAGIPGWGAVLNVTDGAACEVLIGEIEKRFGAVSILVNNAGITRDNLAMRMKDEEWDAVIDTNLKSVFRLSKLVLRGMMKARHGRIINISSVVAAFGNPGQINYAASKAGVAGMSRAMAQEVGSRNITVNCVAPGFIDTAMTRALTEEQRNALIQRIPLGRLGQAEDVANAVAFLAGPEAAYVTGTMLHVNGGMYMSQ